MPQFLIDIYRESGVQGVSVMLFLMAIAVAIPAIYPLLRVLINRQNAVTRQQLVDAEKDETISKIARDSTTSLDVQRGINQVLLEDKARLERELEKAYSEVKAADDELVKCRKANQDLIGKLRELGE